MVVGTEDFDRLSSLVDHKNEEPDVEYKTWMDLSTPENKAKTAKHLCSLANYGGGWLIFGIADDGSHAEPHPQDLSGYKQDLINSIVSRYLHPAFHCNVHFVKSSITQKTYPVVQIPPHGPQPVSAKTDGPLVNNQRVGVTRGAHYIRVPGPQSVVINQPEQWQQVLRRCVSQEREQLIASIGRLFEAPTITSNVSSLDDFIKELVARWDDIQKTGWPTDSKKNRTALGFQILTDAGQPVAPLSLNALAGAVRESSNQVQID